MNQSPLYELKDIDVTYDMRGSTISALQGISLKGNRGETLGIVGESGCGKSTLAKVLMGMVSHKRGYIIRPKTQMVFQDPDASLNPRMTVYNHLKEALIAHGVVAKDEIQARIDELFQMLQIPAEFAEKYPYQLSGGQKQRICIARALSVDPELVVCDEPLASLDISISAQIILLFKRLQQEKNLSYLFITHDLALLSTLAHTVSVLYLGNIVEYGPKDALYQTPLHPYTQALLSSILQPDPELEKRRPHIVVPGELPSIIHPPAGCPFHTRCPFVTDLCRTTKPALVEHAPGHFVACHLHKISGTVSTSSGGPQN